MGKKSKKQKGRPKAKSPKDKGTIRLHLEAISALKIIQSHDAVNKNVSQPVPRRDGGFVIRFQMEVELPSRARRKGISGTGVRSQEPVLMYFKSTYPFLAPRIMLRPDFNRSLPHLNPSFSFENDDYVCPCVFDGNLDDLLHQEGDGLSEILNYLSDWLGKAASNDLIDPDQGWEPIRRDENYGWVVYDLSGLRSLVQDKENAFVFPVQFWKERYSQEDLYFVYGINHKNPQPITPWMVQNSFYADKSAIGTVYSSLAIFVKPNKMEKHSESVVDQYLPENIQNLEHLFERAEDYGCHAPLKSTLIDFCWAFKKASLNLTQFPLFVILCARRPCPLIGDDSPLELIPYMISCNIDETQLPITEIAVRIRNDSPVLPLGHRHALSSRLLRKMSGGKEILNSTPTVFIGCGSIGSKIAMHLARAGQGPFCLIDRGIFSPHNAARHALTGLPEIPGQPKALLLAQEIKLLRQDAEPICDDIINICKHPKNKSSQFPKDTRLIIESTGSQAVREMLTTLSPNSLPGRLFHAALYEDGKIGIVAIEGPSRNPNVNDLIIRFWDERIDNPGLTSKFTDNTESLSRQEVGLGCGSHTMVMSDGRVSVFAAGMSERARQILEKGASDTGEIWFGLLDNHELGVAWEHFALPQTTVLKIKAQNRWEVRILKEVSDQIAQDVKEWGNFETGGVLIGRISLIRRCFTVSRVIQAPPDSERSETAFVLGVEGLTRKVQEILKKSGGTLNYVGTWHSHPHGGGASSIDKKSLERIKTLRFKAPFLGLIWTPSGFKAIIDEGKLA